MNKKHEEPQMWVVAEEDDYVHIIPNWDTRPHGNVLEPVMGKIYLSLEDCSCNPEVRDEDEEGKYGKPMIIHNSFLQMEIVNKSIKKILK